MADAAGEGEREAWPRGRSRHGGVDEMPLPPLVPGRLWLAGRRFVGPDPEAAMAEVEADRLVCLCERFELDERYPAYVRWLAREDGGRARWWPVPDLHAPDEQLASRWAAYLVEAVSGGQSVLVHCGAGMGRAGTMAAAMLITMGAGLEEAVATVAAARPGAGPEVGPQMDLLVALARRPA